MLSFWYKLLMVSIIALILFPANAEALSKRKSTPKVNRTHRVVTVVIDAGHGGHDSGAIAVNKRYEKSMTLAVAKMVQRYLNASRSIHVVMTRSNDRFITLADRAAWASKTGAVLFVSIHGNSERRHVFHGTETYFLKTDSIRLARTVHKAVMKTAKLTDRRVRKANDYVLRNNTVPAILIELGYLSNRKEAAKLYQNQTQQRFARGIAEGIRTYLKM